jgi:hypothetical protein
MKVKQYTKTWTKRLVADKLYKDEITELSQNHIPENPNKTERLRGYQMGLSEFMGKLDKDKEIELEEIKKKWNAKGPPADIKARLAEKYGLAKVVEFQQQMWRQYGMRFYTFAAFKGSGDTIICTDIDNNKLFGGGVDYPKTESGDDAISLNLWMAHMTKHYEPNNTEIGDVKGKRGKRGKLSLESNDYGEPILPDPECSPYTDAKEKRLWLQDVIWAFIAGHYCG